MKLCLTARVLQDLSKNCSNFSVKLANAVPGRVAELTSTPKLVFFAVISNFCFISLLQLRFSLSWGLFTRSSTFRNWMLNLRPWRRRKFTKLSLRNFYQDFVSFVNYCLMYCLLTSRDHLINFFRKTLWMAYEFVNLWICKFYPCWTFSMPLRYGCTTRTKLPVSGLTDPSGSMVK